jgi:hypothetical protein
MVSESKVCQQDRVRMHLWDWREQPDVECINASIQELFDGTHCPYVVAVPDTHRDEYVVFIAPTYLGPNEAQALWDDWNWDD